MRLCQGKNQRFARDAFYVERRIVEREVQKPHIYLLVVQPLHYAVWTHLTQEELDIRKVIPERAQDGRKYLIGGRRHEAQCKATNLAVPHTLDYADGLVHLDED